MNLHKHRQKDKPDLLIDLAPLIDVVFILLIFFMVSTTFSRESAIEVSLPEAAAQTSETPPEVIEVSIDERGHYFVNGKSLVNDQVETLKRALSREAKQHKDSPPIVLNADASAPHQAVIRVMDAARQVGLTRLSFATQQTPDAPQ